MPSAESSRIVHRIEIAPRTIVMILLVIAGVWMLGQLTTVLSVLTIALVLVGTFDPVISRGACRHSRSRRRGG